MENQKKKVKRLKGFTLGEMVTTVTIVGSLTAIAVPNYLRVRMEVNMEMVRQELRTIQKHMNDLLNRDKRFPQDINTLGNTPEEQSITGSLSAIGLKDYTTDGYRVDPNLSNYQLTTCPTKIGISGDKCFTVDTSSISSAAAGLAAPWDGAGVVMQRFTMETTTGYMANGFGYNYQREYMLAEVLGNSAFSTAERIELMTQFLKASAFEPIDFANIYAEIGEPITGLPSSDYLVPNAYLNTLNEIMPEVYKNLKNLGLQVYVIERDISTFPSADHSAGYYDRFNSYFSNPKMIDIAYKAESGCDLASIAQDARNWMFDRMNADARAGNTWLQSGTTSSSCYLPGGCQ